MCGDIVGVLDRGRFGIWQTESDTMKSDINWDVEQKVEITASASLESIEIDDFSYLLIYCLHTKACTQYQLSKSKYSSLVNSATDNMILAIVPFQLHQPQPSDHIDLNCPIKFIKKVYQV